MKKSIVTTREILTTCKKTKNPVRMAKKYRDFFGTLPLDEQFVFVVHGAPYGGKSSFMLKVANELAKYYPVLFANLEEKIGLTLRNKLVTMKINQKIDFLNKNTPEEMKNLIYLNEYKFVIIDSVSTFCNSEKDINELFSYIWEHENTSFFLIAHQTKAGSYRGTTNLAHLADAVFEVNEGVVTPTKNRFHYSKKHNEFKIFQNL